MKFLLNSFVMAALTVGLSHQVLVAQQQESWYQVQGTYYPQYLLHENGTNLEFTGHVVNGVGQYKQSTFTGPITPVGGVSGWRLRGAPVHPFPKQISANGQILYQGTNGQYGP